MMEVEESIVGNYTIQIVKKDSEIIGAIISGPRLPRPVYVPRRSQVVLPKLPKQVKRYLKKLGFNV